MSGPLVRRGSHVLTKPVPVCSKEPRIKGSFKGLALIYGEVRSITRKAAPLTFYQIIFVLYQIVSRMDNMLHLRTAYGSGPLEQHNVRCPKPYAHRYGRC